MKLSDYPRPPADNGRGIHWSPSQYQWGRKDWLKWQKRALEMGLKWVKINVPPDYNAEAVTKRFIDIEIMPVCRFIRKNPTRIDGAIEKSIERLVNLGVRYFETNNEPDADIEWVNYYRPKGWEEVVMQNLIYDANLIFKIGGHPALVAFNTGPTEPRNAIQVLLAQPGGREIMDKGLWVSLHNYGKGRPFNYPNDRVRMFGDPVTEEEWLNQGQPASWTPEQVREFVWHNATREEVNAIRQKQKDPNINIMTDITCFRAYEYWNTLITQEGLDPLPIMMTEGGWETGDRIDEFYPEPTAQRASELNFKMFQFIQGDIEMTIYKPDGSTESSPVPDYLFAVMPWHMGEKEFGYDTSGQWEQGAWFTHWYDQKFELNGELPIIQMLRDLPSNVRADGPVPPEWSKRKRSLPAYIAEWDYRFNYLKSGIDIEPAEEGQVKWQLVTALWQDKDERNPKETLPPGYIMVRVLDQNNQGIPNAEVEIIRRDDKGNDIVDKIQTKGQFDRFLGNYRMSGSLGTYRVRVSHQGYASDTILNVGLGGEEPESDFDQTSFLLIFKLAGLKDESAPAETTPSTAETPAGKDGTSAAPETENDAEALGVKVIPVSVPPVAHVKSIHHVTPEDRLGAGTLYLDVLDSDGKRAFGAVVLVKDATDSILQVKIEKPVNEPGGNMPMWANNAYTIVGLEQAGKEIACPNVTGLRSAIPNKGEGHSFVVVLQVS